MIRKSTLFLIPLAVMKPAVLAADQLVLETPSSRLVMELKGGGITNFQSRESGINPLTWDSQPGRGQEPDSARQRGHFICLDRWGPPSEAEAGRGMTAHGEASRVDWMVTQQPHREGDYMLATAEAGLPMAGLTVWRSIRLSHNSSVFHVTESVRNNRDLGRIYNLVQHPTIAPPFLNGETVISCNATRGFPQNGTLPDPGIMASKWPVGLAPDGSPVDIRLLDNSDVPSVTSYIFEDPIGWVVACDPASGTLLGYLWKRGDYPWINLWRRASGGKPAARGLEFGTTGLHRPYADLVEKGKILGRPLFKHIDAGEIQTFDYIGFLASVPEGFTEVKDIRFDKGFIILRDVNQTEKQVPVDISLLRP